LNKHGIPKDPSKQLLLPKLQNLPKSFPVEGAVKIELVEGIPIFRASSTVRERIDALLAKEKTLFLNTEEKLELDLYAEIYDDLSGTCCYTYCPVIPSLRCQPAVGSNPRLIAKVG